MSRKNKTIDRLLTLRAKRLGVSRDEALQDLNDRASAFFEDLRRRAALKGKSIAEVLASDRRRVREAVYDDADCLQPEELEQLLQEASLDDQRMAHLQSCLTCQALVEAARPNPQKARRVAKQLASIASARLAMRD